MSSKSLTHKIIIFIVDT